MDYIYWIGLIVAMAFGFVALGLHTAVESYIDRLEDLLNNGPKCEKIVEVQHYYLRAIEKLEPWRTATFYGFIVVSICYFISLLFGN